MDEQMAWSNFINTGLVNDYLIYRKIHSMNVDKPQEDIQDANNDRRTYYNGTKYR